MPSFGSLGRAVAGGVGRVFGGAGRAAAKAAPRSLLSAASTVPGATGHVFDAAGAAAGATGTSAAGSGMLGAAGKWLGDAAKGTVRDLVGSPGRAISELRGGTAFQPGGLFHHSNTLWSPSAPADASTFRKAVPWVNRAFTVGVPAIEAANALAGGGDPNKGRMENALGALGSGLGFAYGMPAVGMLGANYTAQGGRMLGEGVGRLFGRPQPQIDPNMQGSTPPQYAGDVNYYPQAAQDPNYTQRTASRKSDREKWRHRSNGLLGVVSPLVANQLLANHVLAPVSHREKAEGPLGVAARHEAATKHEANVSALADAMKIKKPRVGWHESPGFGNFIGAQGTGPNKYEWTEHTLDHRVPTVIGHGNTPFEVMAHEVGHAANYERTPRLSGHPITHQLNRLSPAASMAASYYAGSQDDPSYVPAALNAAFHAPQLLEEGRASYNALRAIHDMSHAGTLPHGAPGVARAALTTLLPAFGSYAMTALAPLGITALRQHQRSKSAEELWKRAAGMPNLLPQPSTSTQNTPTKPQVPSGAAGGAGAVATSPRAPTATVPVVASPRM